MAFTRTASGVCVANLHATNDRPALAVADVAAAPPRAAIEWAGEAPLLFGGDLNLRPRREPRASSSELRERFGLAAPDRARRDRPPAGAGPVASSSRRRPGRPSAASSSEDGLALRLSDHTPVEARFETAAAR